MTLDELNELAARGHRRSRLHERLVQPPGVEGGTPGPRDRSATLGLRPQLVVWSATGYARRFPVEDLERLWLVTEWAGRPCRRAWLSRQAHRSRRRGFWWVKWVVRIETSPVPWWVQLPYPAT